MGFWRASTARRAPFIAPGPSPKPPRPSGSMCDLACTRESAKSAATISPVSPFTSPLASVPWQGPTKSWSPARSRISSRAPASRSASAASTHSRGFLTLGASLPRRSNVKPVTNFSTGSLIGSIDLAIDKAVTARMFDKATSDLARLAQPGKPLFGVQESNAGKVVIFGGGVPVVLDGTIVGAVGASASTVEQDIAVAEAAVAGLVV